MIAAIYARKSTEQNGVADEEKSVARQIEHAKLYAVKKGWSVAEEHIYMDDGISGAEFVKRPGFVRLMNALKPKPPFQVLIMSEESRLGREAIETAYATKQIMDAGVRVFFYLEDRERTLDTAMDKIMLSLSTFAAEMEREKASQRTHDAMTRKARAGFVTGNRVYGYDNVPVGEPSQHVIRRVNNQEKEVVLRIFKDFASGTGTKRIAMGLNGEKVTPPRGGRHGWSPASVREMLHRDLYAGIVCWNRTQRVQRGGTKKQRKRTQAEWLKLDAPDLRIIPSDLWKQVQSRHAHNRTVWLRDGQGHLQSRPSGGDLRSPYLLSGLAQCAICEGSLVGVSRPRGGGSRKVYVCVYAHKRGPSVCKNNVRLPQETLDSAILHALNDVLDERVLEAAVEQALRKLREGRAALPDQRTAILRELSLLESRLTHLVEAIATGDKSKAVFTTLKIEEARKEVLQIQLTELDDLGRIASLDAKRVARDLRERVGDIRSLLGRHVTQARQMLRKVLDGKIRCEPFEENGVRGYRYRATGSYGGLFASGIASVNHGHNGFRISTPRPAIP